MQFDWQAIHAELERRLSHLDSMIEDDATRVEALLRERTIALAAPPRDARGQHQVSRALVFKLAEGRYALSLDHAQEVTGLSRTAVVPGASSAILGIIIWRGEFVVVFDLASLLGHSPTADPAQRRVIVLRGEEPRIALAVDAVEEIIQVDPSALQAPQHLISRRAELFRGATADAVLVLAEDNLVARLTEELQAA